MRQCDRTNSMAEATTIKNVGPYRIDTNVVTKLGQTHNCIVFPGEHESSQEKVAAKMFTWGKESPPQMVKDEADRMRNIPEHKHVLKYLDYFKTENEQNIILWLILEYCALGDLQQLVAANPFNICQKVDLMLQSAAGVEHLHQHNLIHRDVKPANILVTGHKHSPIVKVADFGVSRGFHHERDDAMTNMTALGTPTYKAPELYSDENKPLANRAIDTYSLALTFLFLLDEVPPKTEDGRVIGRAMYEKRITDVAALIHRAGDSAEAKEVKCLIAEMLALDPLARPSMQKVVSRLSQLRDKFGVSYLVGMNSVWQPPTLQVHSDIDCATLREMMDQLTRMLAEKEEAADVKDPRDADKGMAELSEQGCLPRIRVAPENTLRSMDWYHGNISRKECEKQLLLPDNIRGTFCVRDSTSGAKYTLSVRSYSEETGHGVKHYKIESLDSGEYVLSNSPKKWPTIPSIIEHYTKTAPGFCTKLTQPCPKLKATLHDASTQTPDNLAIPDEPLVTGRPSVQVLFRR